MTESLLQLGGRLHPMLLHLPIGLLVGLGLVEAWARLRRRPLDRGVRMLLVWLAALSAAGTAVSGLLLAREGTYGGNVVDLHRWLGIGVAGLALVAAVLLTMKKVRGYGATLALGLAVLVPAGHFGASMTHGAGFLTAPFARSVDAPPAAAPGMSVYAAEVEPVFATYCIGCHSTGRRKGGLALHTPSAVLAGGKSGPVIVPASAAESELIQRLRLPAETDGHMPPASKPQPTAAEIDAIARWIDAGAVVDPSRELIDADEDADTTTEVASAAAPTAAPPEAALAALRETNVHAEIIDPATGALWIDFSAAPDIDATTAVDLLAPIAPFITELGLSRSVGVDAILAAAPDMNRLRTLDVSRSDVTARGVSTLATLATLEEINLVHTTVGDEVVADLVAMPALRRVHTWNTSLSVAGLGRLRAAQPDLAVNAGDDLQANALETEPPFAVGATGSLAPVNSTCPVSGAPVDPGFAIVHEGRVIAFCCATCAGKFWADPGAFDVSGDG